MTRDLLNVDTPDRWVNCDARKYPAGGNPWTEIYTQQVSQEIAVAIAINDPDIVRRLRLQLAATAEYLTAVFGFVGGAATPSKKYAWANKLGITCSKATSQLKEATENLSTVSITDKEGRTRVVTASEMRKRVERTCDAIEDLRLLLSAVEKFQQGVEGGTNHSQTLQTIVDVLTEVFIDFVGIEDVKRVAFDKDVDGLFPEFIRTAAKPLVAVHYPKSAASKRNVEKLNRQIQEAVARYARRD